MIQEGNFGAGLDDEIQNFVPRITVMGVGGAGCNAINNMVSGGIDGVEFIAANTDAQSLMQSKAKRRIQLGRQTTRGFGAGSKPEVGETAAEESRNEIADAIKNSNILFLAAGMGGGTGSGGLPVIASIAKEKGILTVAIITTPFDFEGEKRRLVAERAVAKVAPCVDCIIILPNQNLFKIADPNLPLFDAFRMSDNVLYEGVKNIADLIMKPGLVNLDFADIRAIMENRGKTIIGVAKEEGEGRALRAVSNALSNPLLSDGRIDGARGVLVNITGNSKNLTLPEVNDIMNAIRANIRSADANFVFGARFDDGMGDALKVAVIATGIDSEGMERDSAPEAGQEFVSNAPSETFGNYGRREAEENPAPESGNPFMDACARQVVGPEKLDSFFETGDEGNIQDFIDEEAEKFRRSDDKPSDLFARSDDDVPEPPKGRKKNPLSDFFSSIGSGSDDTFFDDAERIEDDGEEMRDDVGITLGVPAAAEEKKDGNVVFLAGSLDDKGKADRQTDLMEMIRKMEETLEIPAIFKKK
ncbi:MAG: cell division protein FtsZ [Rickettsiales bacterium]|jgi:cell division protein FtsZ|nr:cell division protein FtsZ [Rickettsiales bacterium]